jgi:hypothetical protein
VAFLFERPLTKVLANATCDSYDEDMQKNLKLVMMVISLGWIPISVADNFSPSILSLPWVVGPLQKSANNGGLSPITVHSKTVALIVRDYGQEDGDIVTIKLNEEIVLDNFFLKNEPKQVSLELKYGVNQLEVVAETIGDKGSPNTAEMTISHVSEGKAKQIWDLKLGQMATMEIVVR